RTWPTACTPRTAAISTGPCTSEPSDERPPPGRNAGPGHGPRPGRLRAAVHLPAGAGPLLPRLSRRRLPALLPLDGTGRGFRGGAGRGSRRRAGGGPAASAPAGRRRAARRLPRRREGGPGGAALDGVRPTGLGGAGVGGSGGPVVGLWRGHGRHG